MGWLFAAKSQDGLYQATVFAALSLSPFMQAKLGSNWPAILSN
jgi:hypothetical protein